MFALKLENGYNIGLEKAKVRSVKVIKEYQETRPVLEKPKAKAGLKTIMILHTGGTISSKVSYKTGGVVSRFSPEEVVEIFPELKGLANVETKLVRNMFSSNIRFAHYNLLAKEIEKALKVCDGVIVTHGTDTLHYSSVALAFILEGLEKPVLLVGAQRSSDRGGSDAALNLLCAVQFAVKTEYAGVAVCMHEKSSDDACLVFHPCKVRKMHTSRRDAFKAVNGLPLARVWKEGKVEMLSKMPERQKDKLKLKLFNEKLKIGILKAHPNLWAEEVKKYEKFDGVVIEGTGMGHVSVEKIDEETSENEVILKEISKLAKKIPVVMTSQCIFGRVDMSVYEYGRKLLKTGILGNLSDMTPETAFVKLAWLVSNYKDKEVRELIGKNLRGEISERSEFVDEFV